MPDDALLEPTPTAPAPTTADADEARDGRIGYGRFGRWTPLALAALLTLSLLAIGIFGQREAAPQDTTPAGGAQVGALAPDFRLALLDGGSLGPHDFHGRTVVLNFWASWCEPCKEEMPALQRLADARPDVAVVGVGLRNDTDADARAFAARLGLTFPLGRDTGDPASGPRGPIETAYNVLAAPTTIVIAPDGSIATIALGPQSDEALRRLLERG